VWDCRESCPSNLNFRAQKYEEIDAAEIPYQSAVLAVFTVCRQTCENAFAVTVPQGFSFYVHEIAVLANGRGGGADNTDVLTQPYATRLSMGGYPTLDELRPRQPTPDYVVKFTEDDEDVDFV